MRKSNPGRSAGLAFSRRAARSLRKTSQSRAAPAARRSWRKTWRPRLHALRFSADSKILRAAAARRVPTRNWWTCSGSLSDSKSASGRCLATTPRRTWSTRRAASASGVVAFKPLIHFPSAIASALGHRRLVALAIDHAEKTERLRRAVAKLMDLVRRDIDGVAEADFVDLVAELDLSPAPQHD